MKKIRILYILWIGTRGGAEKQVSELILNMDKTIFDMEVLFIYQKGYWGTLLEKQGIKVTEFNVNYAWKSIMFFILFLLKNKYDLYHCHTTSFFIKLILKLFKKKIIFTVHENTIYLNNISNIKKKFVTGLADFYIVPSIHMKNYYKNYFKLTVKHIYHGVNIRPLRKKNIITTAEAQICKIGTLTHLEKLKGNDILIKSARILLDKKINNFHLYIAGNGIEYSNLSKLIIDLELSGYVELSGLVDDIDSFFDQLDIYASTSLAESLGINVLEAMERALPIVCTSIPSYLEIISDKVNGYCMPPNPEIIADNLEKLILNRKLRNDFGQASYKIVSERFNNEIMVNQYKEFYLTCIEP